MDDFVVNELTAEKISKMSGDEKVALIRRALYSDEHLLKVLVRIMVIVDPEAIEDIAAWFKKQNNQV